MEGKVLDQVFEVRDAFTGDKKNIRVRVNTDGIFVTPEGYGDYWSTDGEGSPVLVEFAEGVPRVVVWDDINVEDNSHIINLDKAAESNREEE